MRARCAGQAASAGHPICQVGILMEAVAKPKRVAMGGTDARYPCRRLFTIAFDTEAVALVRAMAPASNVSVSEQIRTLVEWGIESASDGGRP
jgi:hypothetical protein